MNNPSSSTSASASTTAHRKPSPFKLYFILAVLLLAAFAVLGIFRTDSTADKSNEFYEVKRGDFLISIVEGGNLIAVNEISVRNSVEGTARIIYIVPEGSYVKKGDLLVELDSAEAEDQVNQQLISYEKAQFDLISAQEQLAIQESQATSDIEAALTKLTIAEIDLNKFLKGQAVQTRRDFELQAENIKEKLAVDEDTLKWSEELYEQGFETKSTLDKHKLAVSASLMNLQLATNSLWMWEQFDYDKQLTEYQSIVDEAKRELDRVRHQAKSKLAQFQAEVTTQQSTLDLQKRKLERDQANLANSKVLAPADGLVVYAVNEGRFSSESLIEEGATVRNRQELIKLPDTSQMKISIKIHESHVSKVKAGQPTYVVLDPIPDQRFKGVVSKVGLLPDAQSRFGNPDLKVYKSEILILDPLPPDVKPGVSAHAEVIITNLTDVLTVPVQAVTTLKGKPVVYMPGTPPKAMPVEVGMFNTKFIEVTSGLKEGDRVLLSPPFDSDKSSFGDEIMEEGDAIPQTSPEVLEKVRLETSPGAGNANGGERPPGANDATAAPGEGRRRGGGPNGGGGGAGGFNREEMMKKYDVNKDGELDETEREAMRKEFQQRTGTSSSRGTGERPNRPAETP